MMDETDTFTCEEWNGDYICACKVRGRVVIDFCGEELTEIYLSKPRAAKFAMQLLEICGEDNKGNAEADDD